VEQYHHLPLAMVFLTHVELDNHQLSRCILFGLLRFGILVKSQTNMKRFNLPQGTPNTLIGNVVLQFGAHCIDS
jgi:hypothetical protein